MRPILVLSIIAVAVGMLAAWLFGGRQLSLWLDHLTTVRVASLPTSPVEYDGGGFRIGEMAMAFVGSDNQRSDVTLRIDSQSRVVLARGGQSFILGPLTRPPDPSGRPELLFTPEPGDELSFRVERSAMSWPTFFQYNFVSGGPTPKWGRHLYYILTWKKRSGERLQMLWRYKQVFLEGKWTEGFMAYDSTTGLLRVEISAAGK